MKTTQLTYDECLTQIRADLAKWNAKQEDSDDRLSLNDWIGEAGPNFYGYTAFRDEYGEWSLICNPYK
jgi:hypothetical protein